LHPAVGFVVGNQGLKPMPFTAEQLQAVMTGTEENRVEALRQSLAYPMKQRDPGGSRFWFLRPGVDKLEAEETCPIAVGFYPELNSATDQELKSLLTSPEKQQEIYGHYTSRVTEQQPVMYLLLPSQERTGRVPLVLPTEGGLRQRQVQTFGWNESELLGRLSRLQQGQLPIAAKALHSIPLVEWVFYPAARTASELAKTLAEAARRIEQAIPKVYAAEETDGYLHKLLKSFQRELLPTLQLTSNNEKDYSFADIYAQTIAYALFTARVFSYVRDKREGKEKETHFDRESAWKQLPETNPFLRRLFQDVSKRSPEELGDELIGAIADIFGILRAAKMDAILSDFRQKMNREDIVIRFYEDFLKAYKPQMRESRGVYYTPEPVVSYIVRSVDQMLKDKFNKPLGLADPEVMILDPACGTATFLLQIFQLIHQRFQENPAALTAGLVDSSWSGYVKKRLLKRIHGFELLMAPYAIAHLKLSLFLEETGYQFDSDQRLAVYLTNTLDDAKRKSETLFEGIIAEEADQATEIKLDKQIMVVVGNPPYSGHSANVGLHWIDNLLRGKDIRTGDKTGNYFEVDDQPLGERNPKWLNNDYVKFIRFAQWRIEQTGHGILAFITDHSYLDNPTFRGMRQSLMATFDNICVLDLHGNSRKRERSPDGSTDDNVFDIQQGASISIFAKWPDEENQVAIVNHSHLWGVREVYNEAKDGRCLTGGKYHWLWNHDFTNTQWTRLTAQSPFYLLVPQNTDRLAEYELGWKVTEIFPVNSVGIVTARDHLTIGWSAKEVWKTVQDFASLPVEKAREKYALGADVRDWKVHLAQADVRSCGPDRSKVVPVLYRPFDVRSIYYTGQTRGFICMPRPKVMHHMLAEENVALITSRLTKGETFKHAQVTTNIAEVICMSPKTSNNGFVFPLYLYPGTKNHQQSALEEKRRPNFSQNFLNTVNAQLGYTPTPEAIFYYIYAIFHSPTYRTRYVEFLKIDFPRVPLTSDSEIFCQMAAYGENLAALHLMISPKLENLITQFVDRGGSRVVDAGHPKFQQGDQFGDRGRGEGFIQHDNSTVPTDTPKSPPLFPKPCLGDVVINRRGDRFAGVPEDVWNFYVGGYQVCQKWLKDRKGRILRRYLKMDTSE
jgi:type I restriction-modification system DNA methylase subunit